MSTHSKRSPFPHPVASWSRFAVDPKAGVPMLYALACLGSALGGFAVGLCVMYACKAMGLSL